MAGIMVSAATGVMKPLLGKLATLMGEEFSKLKNLRKEVKSISDELRSMDNFLERFSDVDELENQTKEWRDEVREMSYDMEDIIDDFKQQIGEKAQNSGSVNNMIERLKTLIARHQIPNQIKEIKKLVLQTSERRKRYDHHIPPSSDVAVDQRVVALYANSTDLIGIEEAMNELVGWIKVEEKKLKVTSIVGFGGLGKTTLANEVCRKLKKGFDCTAFLPVSQKPNIQKLLGSLLSQVVVGKPSYHDYELNVLLDKLREHLHDKRYLIIIDDMWSISEWSVIKCAFPENGLGSRVIVTTRIQGVAKECCSDLNDYIFEMKPLSNEDSRKLFFRRIFQSEEACPLQLRNVAGEILKKCHGVPLAIMSISSMLASGSEGSNQKQRWEDVRDSICSGTSFALDEIFQILNLSYRDLPPRLKTCLLYLGMYPEDYTIQRSNLELQWMAEGFISTENGQDMARTASNYFNELVNRNLIQPIFGDRGSVTKCRVHDIMLDLILRKCREQNFVTVLDDHLDFTRMEYKIRRLSVRFDDSSNALTTLPSNISMSQVRSVMFFGSFQDTPPLSVFKFLRVLFIDLENATVDLTGLSKLYQLKYLRINQ